jgi:hypothetical protein
LATVIRNLKKLPVLSAATVALYAHAGSAQVIPSKTIVGRDSVVVRAGADYAAGGFHRKMLGDNYRDLWTANIKVPVLDLRTFAGGITAFKEGGGKQAKNLRFITKDSVEYVFRQAHKTSLVLPDQYEGTVIWWIFRDVGSASHPASAAAAAPLAEAVGLLHANPVLVMMPDDPALGEWRKEFGGVLGWIEEYPSVPKDAPAFFGANEVLDSEELLEKMNKDPEIRIDDKTFLRAVLLDMVLGDNDRHPLQWKWIRTEKSKSALWRPMPRDRDKVFVSYEGTLLNLARKFESSLVKFTPTYPDPTALFRNATEYDRRMLADLDRSEWDAAVRDVQQRLTNSVIDDAVAAMPKEYAASSREIAKTLKARRDALPDEATRYYLQLWNVADIHATDAADRATITRAADGTVEVTLQSGKDEPYFSRRFNPADTRRIRVYLHEGDDTALITGAGPSSSIAVRVIGGNGNNSLVDQSTVAGHRNPSNLYDQGPTTGVKYAKDTVAEKADEDLTINTYFNRRPWVRAYGTLIPPIRDHGTSMRPIGTVKTGHGLGLIGRLGVVHKSYGFRRVPYESMWKAEVAYATTNRFEVALAGDKRFESTSFHIPAEAKASQFEVVEFHGFGNDVPRSRSSFYHVKQTQYSFRPAIALSLNPESEISLGPIVRYTSTDSAANRFISEERPYGFPHFGQAGMELKLKYDTRVYPDTLKPRAVLEVDGSAYPAIWDAVYAYESLDGAVSTFLTIPVAKKPVIALRGGGKKLFGDFPYFDAAFLGGSHSLRAENRQRFAGDASLYGSAELRVPVAQFPLILPLDVGLLGFFDTGKVYVDGESPGGWHKTKGVGLWIGFLDPGRSINILFTDNDDHRVITNIGFAF